MNLIAKEVRDISSLISRPQADFPKLDKLVISQAGLLAQRRLARGVKLNHAEATVELHN